MYGCNTIDDRVGIIQTCKFEDLIVVVRRSLLWLVLGTTVRLVVVLERWWYVCASG